MRNNNPNSHSDDSMNENEPSGNIATEILQAKLIIRCSRKQKASYISAAGGAKLTTWVLGVLDEVATDMIANGVKK